MHPMTRLTTTLTAIVLLGLCATTRAQDDTGRLKVIATMPTYGALARDIGGDLVDVVVLCRPSQDAHGVTALPSLMAQISGADLLLYTGLDAEMWLDGMLRGSGNARLLPGNAGAIEMSSGMTLKEVPTMLSRAQGDLHAFGNPHLWTDPMNVRSMGARVTDALAAALPAHAAEIQARGQAFHTRMTKAIVDWLTRYKGLKGQKVVVYHQSWVYFLDRFGLVEAGTIEPKPRVTPTVSHLDELVKSMNELGVSVVIREPFSHPDASDFVQKATGCKVVELSTHPGYPEGVDDIVAHFEYNLHTLADALGLDVPPPSDG